MEETLARNWWAFILRGALAIVFALLLFAWSDAPAASLARIFGVFAISEGALAIGATLGARSIQERPWSLVLEGTIGIGFGLIALIAPFRTLTPIAWVIASWIAMVGLLEGATALQFRRHKSTPRLLVGLAIVSLMAAAALVAWPRHGTIVTVWTLGAWSAFLGAVTFMIGVVLRRDTREPLYELRSSAPSLVSVRRPSSSMNRRRTQSRDSSAPRR